MRGTSSRGTVRPAPAANRRLGALERLIVALAVAVLALALVAPALADGREPPCGTMLVRVARGDSVWSIARSVSGGGDPRGTVRTIRELNGLDDATLVEGTLIRVPASPDGTAMASR